MSSVWRCQKTNRLKQRRKVETTGAKNRASAGHKKAKGSFKEGHVPCTQNPSRSLIEVASRSLKRQAKGNTLIKYRLGVTVVSDEKLTAKMRRELKEKATATLNRFLEFETIGAFYFDGDNVHLTIVKEK